MYTCSKCIDPHNHNDQFRNVFIPNSASKEKETSVSCTIYSMVVSGLLYFLDLTTPHNTQGKSSLLCDWAYCTCVLSIISIGCVSLKC